MSLRTLSRPISSVPHTIKEKDGASAKMRPNPSIEGMPKRLRLLVTPHVKR